MLEDFKLLLGSLPRAGILHIGPFVPGRLLQLQLGVGWGVLFSPGAGF